MADASTTSPAAAPVTGTAYVAASTYSVTLKRTIEWPKGSGIMHSPRKNPHKMTGAVCLEIADGIADAKPV